LRLIPEDKLKNLHLKVAFFLLSGLCVRYAVAQTAARAPQAPVVAQLQRTAFGGHEAWRFSDGHTYAVVVPALARVMEYGFVGEKNILWNNPDDLSGEEIKNYGGDKTWLAPQSQWRLIGGSRWSVWPPDPAWEQVAHTARVLPGPVLRVDGPASRASGVALSREYSFASNGDFVISQIAAKKSGPPLFLSLWSITQVPKPDAMYLPLNPASPYQQGFHWQSAPRAEAVTEVTSTLLQLRTATAGDYKIGADAPVATIVAVRDGIAFRLRAPKPAGQYPDGADKAGFPVEIYSSGPQKKGEVFCELELLGPLKFTRAGQSWRHTVRWDLRRLANRDSNSAAQRAEVEVLLTDAEATAP
jgi:hypothetical protein